MKTDLTKITEIIKKHRDLLRNNYRVKNIGFFGSVANKTNKESSDIDILVEFIAPVGFFKFIDLEETLSRLLGKKVDLVTKKALKPAIKEEVLRQTVYV